VPSGVGADLDVEVMLGNENRPSSIYRGFGLFSYAAPEVSTVNPSIGNSAGGLPVTLSGSNFGAADFRPRAFVGSRPCARTIYVSDDKIVCVTPPGGGWDAISVAVARQNGRPLPSAFEYAAPSLSRVYPDSGPLNGRFATP
jgi:hypothetical protein